MSPSIINSFSVVLKVHILFSSKCKHPAWGWGALSGFRPGEEKKNTHTHKKLKDAAALSCVGGREWGVISDWKRRSLSLPLSHCSCNWSIRYIQTGFHRKTTLVLVQTSEATYASHKRRQKCDIVLLNLLNIWHGRLLHVSSFLIPNLYSDFLQTWPQSFPKLKKAVILTMTMMVETFYPKPSSFPKPNQVVCVA